MQTSRPAFANFDPAHLFDGLFVPTSGKKRGRLLVSERMFGGAKISFQGGWQLGADDQSILLAIAAQLGMNGLILNDTGSLISKELKTKLEANSADNIATNKTSLRRLLIDAGYCADKSTDIVAKSLNRLANAQIREIDNNGNDKRSNLISTVFNKDKNETYIAANPRLTAAIFNSQFIQVSLFERNCLESQIAKILHAWLCSNVQLGKSVGRYQSGVSIDRLVTHVWGVECAALNTRVKSNRRSKLKAALAEIVDKTRCFGGKDGEGWQIELQGKIAHIKRPSVLPLLESDAVTIMPSEYHDTMTMAKIEAMNADVDRDLERFMREDFLLLEA